MERKHKLRSILAFMLTFAMILGGLPSSFVSTVYANNSLTFSRTEKVDGMKVTVEADESVFPEGAALSVEKVGREEQEKAEETIESQRESGQMVAASYTYDVKMLDADGNEIQPEDGKRFKISFTLDEIADENLETNVYHIKESGSDVSVTTGSAITDETGEVTVEKLEVETDGDTATAETDGFSLYTVEFTYSNLQYVLPGDSEVELSKILSSIGLSGEVTEVSVSDSSLFSAAKNDSGEWIVTAHKAFSTNEWMKVTINGVEYEITVTDDNPNASLQVDSDFEEGTAGHYYINMSKTGTDTLNLTDDNIRAFKVYDHGGKDEGFITGCDGNLIISVPTGYVLRISGTINTKDCGALSVYDGADKSGTVLLDNAKGLNTSVNFISSGQSVVFHFTSSYPWNGYDITVELISTNVTHNITVNTSSNGTIESVATAKPGDIVTLTAKPDAGYLPDCISVQSGDNVITVNWAVWSKTATFIMPAADVTVTGTFTGTEGGLSVNLPVSGTKKVIFPDGVQSFNIYDDGGKDGNYSDYCDGSLIVTAPEGKLIRLSGECVFYNSSDYLTVYNGYEDESNILIEQTKEEKVTIPATTSAGNSIKLKLYSDKAKNDEGINLTISLVDPNQVYAINNPYSGEGGSVTCKVGEENASEAKANDIVSLTVSPSDGYVLSDLVVKNDETNSVLPINGDCLWYSDNDTVTFTMPAAPVTVTPTFTATSSLTADGGLYINMPISGSKTAALPAGTKSFKLYDDGGKDGLYHKGESTLTLTAPEGYILSITGKMQADESTLNVYDGDSIDSSKLIEQTGSYNETTVDTVLTTGNNLTIRLKNKYDTTHYYGLDLTVNLISPDTEYTITGYTGEGGSVTAQVKGVNATKAKVKDTVTLIVKPAAGYMLDDLSVTDSDGGMVSVTDCNYWKDTEGAVASFKMPYKAVTVTAVFTNLKTASAGLSINLPKTGTKNITIPKSVTSFKLYDDGGSGSHYSENCDGAIVLSAPAGYRLQISGSSNMVYNQDWYSIYNGTSANAGSVIVNKNSEDTYTLSPIVSSGESVYIYLHSDEIGYRAGLDLTVDVIDSNTKYGITIDGNISHGAVASGVTSAKAGDTVSLSITPEAGYVLKNINVTAGGYDVAVNGLTAESTLDSTWYTNSSATFTMPGTAVTVLAEFEAKSNVYVTIPETGSKSCTIPSGLNSFKVYNNSGKDGRYSSLENGTLVLTAPEGYVMHVTGHVRLYGTSALEDYLDIHDGNTTEATKLGQFRCTTGAGSPTNTSVDVTSNANQILLHFVTDGSGYITDNGGVYLTVTLVRLYTVSFANGGGTGTMDSVQVIDNREYTLPACGFPAPENKKFKEWAVKIGDASVEAKAAGDKITVTADTTVTAVWEDKTAITPSVSIEGWTYGDTANTPSVTGNDGNGTLTYEYKVKDAADSTYSATVPTNASEYTVRVTIGETDNYAGGMATADFTISPKKVELEWSNTSLTYNGSPQKPTATVKNLIENDICTVMVSGEKTDAGESYAATAMELSNSNYQLPDTPTTSFSINKKSVTISGITAVNKEYDGNTTAELDISGATVTGLVENDNISFSVSGAFENETKGADKTVNISGWTITSGGGNYKIDVEHSQKTATASITNTQVYISGITVSGKTYDGNASATIETGSLTIKKVRDDSVVDGLSAESIVAAFSDANTGNDKTVMISSATLTGGGNANYTLSIEKTNEKLNLKADIAQAEPAIGTVTADVLNNSTTVSDVRLQRTISTIPGTLELTSTSLNYGTNENCSWRFTPTDDTNYKTITGTVTIIVNDTIVPSGEISIKADKWSEFISTITFGWYKPTDKITITASDEGSGVKQISYFIYETTGTTGMTEQAVKDLEESKWSTYNSPVSISQDKKYIIYARITDNAGGVKYISSGGLAFDGTAPVIIGIDNNASIAFTTSGVELTITDGGELASITVDDTTENASGQSATKKITAAGTHTVKAEDKSGNESTLTFTITKAAINPTITISGWTYGGSENAPTVDGNTGNGTETIEYKLRTANDSAYSTAVPTDAGEYTVRATIAETTNYQTGTATADFTVSKASSTIASAPQAVSGLKWDGSAKALVTAGSTNDGTMVYSLSESGTFAEQIPTGTDAKDYTVYYKVRGDKNHEDSAAAGPVNVTIAKGTDPAVVAGTATVQKGGKTIDLSKSVSGARGTVSFAIAGSGSVAGCAVDEATGVFTSGSTTGTCTVTVTIAESTNCESKTAEIQVSVVDKLTAGLDVIQEGTVYGGTALKAPSYHIGGGTAAPTGGTATITYTGTLRKNGNTYNSATKPTEAGSYSVSVVYENDTTIYSGSASFTITPADIGKAVITLADGSLTYTGSEQTKTVSKVELDSTEISASDYEVAGNKGTNAGTYTITVTAKAASNYTGTATKTFTIAKALPHIQTAPAALQITYGKTLGDSTLTGGTVQRSSSDTTAVTGTFVWKEPDTKPAVSDSDTTEYVVVFTPSGADAINYEGEETKVKLTVAKADHAAVTAAQVEVAAGDSSVTKVNLGTYLESGASLSSSDTQGDLKSSISDVALTGNKLTFQVAETAGEGKTGTILLNVNSANYNTYTITVPVIVKAKSTQVVFDEETGTDTSVSGVSSSNLSDFTEAQTETAVKVVLDVEVKKAEHVDSTVKTKIESELDKVFSDVESTNIKTEFLDMKVTKSVNGGSAETVEDVGRVLEIEVSYDLTGKYNPVIIREHKGTVTRFTELSTKPTGSYKDGTFSVDRTKNKIYIYTEFFSTYSIAYADTPSYQVTFDNDGTKTQVVVKSGGKVTKPTDPTKSGYTFNGWYNGSTAWNFDNDTVSSDLTLTAKWTQNGGGSGSGGSGNGGGSGGGTSAPTKTTPGKPAAPILESKTDTSITVKTVAGQIYSIDGGKNWQASGTFTGLAPETEYSIVTKVSETSTSYESAVSDALKVTTDKKADSSTPTTGPGSTTNPSDKPDDTAAPDSTTSPTVQPGDTATPGGTEAPGSTETPDAGKKPAAKGTVLVDAGKTATYVVTSADAKHPTITYKKCRNKKAKTVTIPKTVKIGGVTYTVTSIAANAFKNHKTLTKVTIGDSIKTIGKNAFYGCKKLKTVTIGKNVTKIGKKAFYGCGKLKKITVKTKKLTLKNVGKSAFSGIYIRASVLVPGDKRKEYALLFRKRGAGKKIRIKKDSK